jgi:hypothetical protein
VSLIARIALTLTALAAAWLGMQAVHELGHELSAWATGGSVERVVLNPLTISRTDVSPNPHPLVVAWGGPVIGVALPLLLAVACRRSPAWIRRLAAFFAGFCLLANGAYIGVGSFGGVGDAGDMLRNGSPPWTLLLFGIVSSAAGLWIWHYLTRRPQVSPPSSVYSVEQADPHISLD